MALTQEDEWNLEYTLYKLEKQLSQQKQNPIKPKKFFKRLNLPNSFKHRTHQTLFTKDFLRKDLESKIILGKSTQDILDKEIKITKQNGIYRLIRDHTQIFFVKNINNKTNEFKTENIGSYNKKTPLKIFTHTTSNSSTSNSPISIANKQVSRQLFDSNFNQGTFIDIFGRPLSLEQEEFTQDLYQRIRESIDIIYPDNTRTTGFQIRNPRQPKNQNQEIEHRTWGQEYLKSLEPTRINIGNTYVDSGTLIYFFDNADLAVIEPDALNKATYIVKASECERIQTIPRNQRQKMHLADGMIQTIRHTNPLSWQRNINSIMYEYNVI